VKLLKRPLPKVRSIRECSVNAHTQQQQQQQQQQHKIAEKVAAEEASANAAEKAKINT